MPKSAVWNECQEETIKQYDDVGNVKEKTDSRAVWHTPDNAVMMIKTMRLMNKEKGKQGRLKRFTDDNEMVENNSVPLSKCQCVCVLDSAIHSLMCITMMIAMAITISPTCGGTLHNNESHHNNCNQNIMNKTRTKSKDLCIQYGSVEERQWGRGGERGERERERGTNNESTKNEVKSQSLPPLPLCQLQSIC